MNPVRLVDVRALLEAACGLALVMALVMPFFTASSGSLIPVQVQTAASVVDAFPRDPFADFFVLATALVLIMAVYRVLHPRPGFVALLLSLASFVAAIALIVAMQLAWSDATSGWQADAARFLGVKFSQSFGFWVYLGAGATGAVIALGELTVRLARGPIRDADRPASYAALAPTAVPYPTVPISPPLASPSTAAGRITFLESGRSSPIAVAIGQCVVFGRDVTCDVRLSDPRVSRRHASVERTSGGWIVRDLGARNPTLVVGPGGAVRDAGPESRVASGQLLIGDVLVTLYP